MASSRYLRALGPVVLLAVGGAYAMASGNWCGEWLAGQPVVIASGRSVESVWRAGAARVELQPPWPVVAAGYPPPRREVTQSSPPLHARAVVLEAEGLRIGLVSLDLLSVSPEIVSAVRSGADAAGLALNELVVVATHTHSSFGGYDPRLVAQLAGTGRFREESVHAASDCAVRALREAASSLEGVKLEVSEGTLEGLVHPRSGEVADTRSLRLMLRALDRPVAELWVVNAHPTLEPRRAEALSPDYPGRVEDPEAAILWPVIVLQGAAGNARAVVPEGEGESKSARFAAALDDRMRALDLDGSKEESEPAAEPSDEPDPEAPEELPVLAFARVKVGLPRPDSSRLAPWFARAAGDNLLCASSEKTAELVALQLGPVRLFAVPGEPTAAAGASIEARAGATRVLGLADGYLGYIESAELVRARSGEAKRQYFRPELIDSLAEAAETAASALPALQ